MLQKVNLAQKLGLFDDHWHPRIVGDVNDSQVKLVKLQGEFVWHDHAAEDELFLVLKGRLTIDYRDGGVEHSVVLEPGELVVIPRGVEHRPRAEEEVHLLLVEPAATRHTGDVEDALTVHAFERI